MLLLEVLGFDCMNGVIPHPYTVHSSPSDPAVLELAPIVEATSTGRSGAKFGVGSLPRPELEGMLRLAGLVSASSSRYTLALATEAASPVDGT